MAGDIKHIISIDPGDVNNGFCYFKYDPSTKIADLRIKDILTGEGVSNVLKTLYELHRDKGTPDPNKKNPSNFFFVVENFRVDTKSRGAIFQWNDMQTSQMIGRVKLCAEWLGAPVFMQEPTILATARKYSPFPVGKGHLKDDISAFLHGASFLIDKKLIATVNQITLFGQERL